MVKYSNPIQKILKNRGPLTSGELAKLIVFKKIASGETNARKTIQRALEDKSFETTHPVRFDRSYLYYLKEHQGKKYGNAVKALLHTKPSFNRVFKTILANKGWITFGQIGKASCCLPDEDESVSGGRKTISQVVKELLDLGIIDKVIGTNHLYRIGIQFGSPEISQRFFQHKITVEQTLLIDALDWLRDCYLLAYDSHTSRSSETHAEGFNQTIWDIHGPIYLGPFTRDIKLRRSKTKENFLVLEIIGYRTWSKVDTEAILERYKNIAFRWNTISVTPIAIAPSFSSNSWNDLRAAGIVPVLFKNVFGRNVDELLRSLWKALSTKELGPSQQDEIEKALKLASGTVINESIVGNLKGILFEVLVALAWKASGFDVTLQKVIQNIANEEKYEVDVLAIRGDDCKLIECKGHHASHLESKKELERHFKKRCALAADQFGWNVTDRYKHVEAIFVTTGKLDSDAATYAKQMRKSHGITCTVWTREKLLSWLKELGQKQLAKIIDRHYNEAT